MWHVLQDISSDYEQMSGVRLHIESGPSMGTTPQSIPQRLAKKQKADVLVMFDDAMKPLAEHDWISLEDRVPLANSYIAMAIPLGHPIPDISTSEKLTQVLLKAKHVVYSDSASGHYISRHMFKKLGIEREMKSKSEMIQATPVGKIVASGKADLGFQQLSELKPVDGITIVGLIPQSIQKASLFSAVTMKNSTNPSVARDFIRFLASNEVASVIKRKSLVPCW